MKSEQEIKKEIITYRELIKECFSSPNDYEERERIKAKINALEWVLDEE